MKLDLSVLKNESINKLEKAHKSIKNKFEDMLSLCLDAAIYEIDAEKRQEVEVVLSDMINDEFSKLLISYTKCMNKVCDLAVNELGK